jgi:hypothetical protein
MGPTSPGGRTSSRGKYMCDTLTNGKARERERERERERTGCTRGSQRKNTIDFFVRKSRQFLFVLGAIIIRYYTFFKLSRSPCMWCFLTRDSRLTVNRAIMLQRRKCLQVHCLQLQSVHVHFDAMQNSDARFYTTFISCFVFLFILHCSLFVLNVIVSKSTLT